ncbi:MAG: rhodanese-like domain-containing protein [Microthrixaceae bacterium]
MIRGAVKSSSSRRTLVLLPVMAALLLLISCGDSDSTSGSGDPAPGEAAAAAALEQGRVVIDVRTPEEYEAGHVEDATLIDIQGPDFAAQIEDLDRDGEYVVYCRSGNRSAVATAQMQAVGLDVLDGGGLDDMVAAGWPEAS